MTDAEFLLLGERSSSLKDFRAFYPSREGCYLDFARRTANQRALAGTNCEACGSSGRTYRKVVSWEIRFQTKETTLQNIYWLFAIPFGGYVSSSKVLRFATHHALCHRCSPRILLRRSVMIVLSLMATIAAAAGVVAAVGMAIYLGVTLAANGAASASIWVRFVLLALAAGVLLWMKRAMDLVEVPAFLRSIAKRPVKLTGILEAPDPTAEPPRPQNLPG